MSSTISNSNWKINKGIRAWNLRVIDLGGEQIGVLTLEEALAKAQKAGLDLVEIAPKAKPPVARIVDFGKFRYEQEKKLREAKKKSKAAELKEVRFSPFIAEGDYMTRMARVSEFLKQGSKVRLVVVFKGRHMDSKKFGYRLIERILGYLGENDLTVAVDMEPKFLGRHLATVISPLKKMKSG